MTKHAYVNKICLNILLNCNTKTFEKEWSDTANLKHLLVSNDIYKSLFDLYDHKVQYKNKNIG